MTAQIALSQLGTPFLSVKPSIQGKVSCKGFWRVAGNWWGFRRGFKIDMIRMQYFVARLPKEIEVAGPEPRTGDTMIFSPVPLSTVERLWLPLSAPKPNLGMA